MPLYYLPSQTVMLTLSVYHDLLRVSRRTAFGRRVVACVRFAECCGAAALKCWGFTTAVCSASLFLLPNARFNVKLKLRTPPGVVPLHSTS